MESKLGTYELESQHASIHNLSPSEEDSDSDMEFDDTNLETPRIPRSSDLRTRSVKKKTPLMDYGHFREKQLSTPRRLGIQTKSSPLKQSPISRYKFESNEENVTSEKKTYTLKETASLLEGNQMNDAQLIRTNKIINDDNKFSPRGSTRIYHKSNGLQSNEDKVKSPPAHSKMGSASFTSLNGGTSEKFGNSSRNTKFNPRDSMDVLDKITKDKMRQDSIVEKIQHPKRMSFETMGIDHKKPSEEHKELKFRNNFEPNDMHSQELLNPAKRSYSNSSFNISDEDNSSSESRTRAEILEKINATIQSFKEREEAEKDLASMRDGQEEDISNEKQHGLSPIEYNPMISHVDANDKENEDILKELDSYIEPPPAPNFATQTEERIQEPDDDFNTLSGMYARKKILEKLERDEIERKRQIEQKLVNKARQRRKEKFQNKVKSTKSKPTKNELISWPNSNWRKLNKIVQLRQLTPDNIARNKQIRAKFNIDEEELRNRVNFLLYYNKANPKNNDNNKYDETKKGNLGTLWNKLLKRK